VVQGPKKRMIAFSAPATGSMTVELEDSGADTNRALACVSSDIGKVEGGVIVGVPVQAGQRINMIVELEREFLGTIRVKANAI
jgi:hypothetical protein